MKHYMAKRRGYYRTLDDRMSLTPRGKALLWLPGCKRFLVVDDPLKYKTLASGKRGRKCWRGKARNMRLTRKGREWRLAGGGDAGD